MKLFGKKLTPVRMLILLGAAFLLYMGFDMIYYSYIPSHGTRTYTETRQPVVIIVVLLFLQAYLWFKYPFSKQSIFEKFEFNGIGDYKYVNMDLIKENDSEWINELKKEHKEKPLIAYSKKGSSFAKRKAKKLMTEKYFVDFIEYNEMGKVKKK